MRHAVALLILSLGLLASACDHSAFGPSQADDQNITSARSLGSKGGVGGSAGGIKGNGR
jgi:hypothetical protein